MCFTQILFIPSTSLRQTEVSLYSLVLLEIPDKNSNLCLQTFKTWQVLPMIAYI